ncbi:hypothetical protein [Lysinibacillus piscis]|nr:hypothetical protein [Lysinibacillus sp. KH24]
MTNQRKKIILNEILFWKQNKLLPEHYCDFLAALYAEGEAIEEMEPILHHKQAVLPSEKRKIRLLMLGLCIGVMALLVLYFTIPALMLLLTIVIGGLAVTLFIVAFRTVQKHREIVVPILHLLAAILLFSMSIQMYSAYFDGNNLALFCLVAANCLIWLWSGIKMKLLYFTVSGILGLLALIGYYIFRLT